MTKQYFATLVCLLILDFVWLGWLMSGYYKEEIGSIMRSQPVWWSAGVVYALMALGLVYFVYPGEEVSPLWQLFLKGFLFGLVLYGVYDFTNFAVLRSYTLKIAVLDVLWGAFACGFTTSLVLSFKF